MPRPNDDPREKAAEMFRRFLVQEHPPTDEEIREFVDLMVQASVAAARRMT